MVFKKHRDKHVKLLHDSTYLFLQRLKLAISNLVHNLPISLGTSLQLYKKQLQDQNW